MFFHGMIAAILIAAALEKSGTTALEHRKRTKPSVPEYLIVAWLCGNVHKLIIISTEYQEKC